VKALRIIVPVLFLSVRAFCSEPEIELSGVLSADGRTKLAFTDHSAGTTRWVEVGGSFAGYTVTGYDAKEETARLTKNETQLRLHLVSAKFQTSPAELSPEIRQAIMENLRQIVAAANRCYLENARTSARLTDLVGPEKYLKELKVADGENYGSLLLLVSARTFSVTTTDGVVVTYEPGDPAPILRECIIRPGDTLFKIARDSGLTVAQLIELNPGVNPPQIKVGQKLRLK
jgi:LysM repeat protein